MPPYYYQQPPIQKQRDPYDVEPQGGGPAGFAVDPRWYAGTTGNPNMWRQSGAQGGPGMGYRGPSQGFGPVPRLGAIGPQAQFPYNAPVGPGGPGYRSSLPPQVQDLLRMQGIDPNMLGQDPFSGTIPGDIGDEGFRYAGAGQMPPPYVLDKMGMSPQEFQQYYGSIWGSMPNANFGPGGGNPYYRTPQFGPGRGGPPGTPFPPGTGMPPESFRGPGGPSGGGRGGYPQGQPSYDRQTRQYGPAGFPLGGGRFNYPQPDTSRQGSDPNQGRYYDEQGYTSGDFESPSANFGRGWPIFPEGPQTFDDSGAPWNRPAPPPTGREPQPGTDLTPPFAGRRSGFGSDFAGGQGYPIEVEGRATGGDVLKDPLLRGAMGTQAGIYSDPNFWGRELNVGQGLQGQMEDYFRGGMYTPEEYREFLAQSGGGINAMIQQADRQAREGLGGLGLQDRMLQTLNQGFPGQQTLQYGPSFQEPFDVANQLFGTPGSGGTPWSPTPYGAPQALLQAIQGGLPNQQAIQDLTGGQAATGQAQQQELIQFLNAISGGGVPLNLENFQMGQRALTGQLAPSVQPQQIPGLPQAQAGQAQTPGFFQDLVGRAFGAGQGLATPQVGNFGVETPNLGGVDKIGAPGFQQPGAATPSAIQGTTESTLSNMLAGGGISPDFVSAMRSRVLEPSMEALRGRLNVQGGGQASLDSPLFQELQRRQEADFNADLLRFATEQMPTLLGQGAALGQQGFGQGLSNIQTQQQAQQFGAGQGLQAALANQQAGLQGSLFNVEQQQRARESTAGNFLQAALANQQAGLQTQALGTNAGLQGLGMLPGLAQTDIGRQLSNAQLGLTAGQGNIENLLKALTSNQQAGIQAGGMNQQAAIQQADLGQRTQQDYWNQAIQSGALRGQIAQQGIGNAMQGFGAIPQSAFPFIQEAGRLGLDINRSLMDRYGGIADRSMNAVDLAQRVGLAPGQFSATLTPGMLGNQAQLFEAARGIPQDAGRFLEGIQQAGIGRMGQATQLNNAFLTGIFQDQIARNQRPSPWGGIAQAGVAGGSSIAAAMILASAMASSKRFKRDEMEEVQAEEMLEVAEKIPLKKWQYKWHPKKHVGFILEEVDPRLSTEAGTIDVDIFGVLVGAIQAQSKKIKALERKLNATA